MVVASGSTSSSDNNNNLLILSVINLSVFLHLHQQTNTLLHLVLAKAS